ACNYPLAQYATLPALPTVPSSLFTTEGQQLVTSTSSAPLVFGVSATDIFTAYSGANPFTSLTAYTQRIQGTWKDIVSGPQIAVNIGKQVAVYLFLGLVMIAIDLAITVGFINGLGKGLNSLSSIFGVEPL